MFKWMDRVYVNARKKIFKNMDTGEILNLELQDDPDNISQDSETPITAHCLNLAQQELMDDLGKLHKDTNIIAPTVAGWGRINKLYGNTVEEGTGEKSPDNPYTLKSVGDDVNLFDMKWLTTRVLPSTEQAITEIIPFTFEAGTYTVSNKLDNGGQLNASYMSIIFRNSAGENIFTKTVNGTFEITEEQAKSVRGINLYYNAKGHVGSTIVEFKLQKGSVATPYTPYGYGNIENISKGKTIASNVSMIPGMLSSSTGQLNTSYIAYASANEFVAVKENTSYRIDNDQNRKVECVFFYDKNKSYLGYVVANKRNYFVTSTNAKYIKFRYLNTSDITDINSYITGVTVVEASSNVVIAKPPCSIGDVRDEIDYTNKKITRRCNCVVFNGSEDDGWNISSKQNDNYACFYSRDVNIGGNYLPKSASQNCISNMFVLGDYTSETIDKNMLTIGSTLTNIQIAINKSIASTVAELRTFLASNPIVVVYELETPIIEDIECSNKLVQYDGTTNIYNTDGAEIEVSLNNSEAISDINENLKNVEETKSNLKTIDIDVTTPSDNNWLKIIDASAYGIDVKKIKNISILIETTYAYFLDQMYSRYYISGTGIYIAILLNDYLNKPAKITIFYED